MTPNVLCTLVAVASVAPLGAGCRASTAPVESAPAPAAAADDSRSHVRHGDTPAATTALPAGAYQALLDAAPQEQWYGVYMLGWKVGHARIWARRARADEAGAGYVTGTDIEMTVKGPGRTTRMKVAETRLYGDEPPHALVETTFEQSTPLGSDRRRAVATAGGMQLSRVGAEDAEPRMLSPSAESLSAALVAMPTDVDSLRPGTTASVRLFDWQTERDQALTVTVVAVETLLRSGVAVKVGVLGFRYDDMGLEGTTRVGDGGVMLETSVGAGLTLRLEERAVATAGIQGLDVLGAGVEIQGRIAAPRDRTELALRVKVPRDAELPSDASQEVSRRSDGTLDLQIRSGPGAPVVDDTERELALGVEGPIDPEAANVRALASRLAAQHPGREALVRALAHEVFTRLDKRLATHVPSAAAVLEQGVGDCTEHTWLFVALARAAGVPARPVYGLMYLEGERPSFGYHAWAEVELEGRWVAVDPTWDQVPADATHLRLGHAPHEVAAVMGGIEIRLVSPPSP